MRTLHVPRAISTTLEAMLRCKGLLSKVLGGIRRLLPPSSALLLAGWGGPQVARVTAGREAGAVAGLFWIMRGGAVFIWVLVIGTAVYAAYIHPDPHRDRVARWFLLGGGVALPVAVLTALLVYGLLLMGSLRSEGEGLRLAVTGEQWWWRVSYSPEGGGDVRSEEHTSELQSLMRTSYAVFCLKKKKKR